VGGPQQVPVISHGDRHHPISSQHGGLGTVLLLPQPPQRVRYRLDADDMATCPNSNSNETFISQKNVYVIGGSS